MPDRTAQIRRDLQAVTGTPQHRRQEQSGEKQHVIDAGPDMPQTFVKIGLEYPPDRWRAAVADLDLAALRAEHGRVQRVIELQRQQAAMLAVENTGRASCRASVVQVV